MGEDQDQNDMMTTSEEGYDLGTFNFLKVGWWVWHVIAIGVIFYLGYLLGGSIF